VSGISILIGTPNNILADVDEVLRVVDWSTHLFFIALFMLVGAIQEV
jgi:Na+/H+ antiporter NhaD/arsenite permease-like protein